MSTRRYGSSPATKAQMTIDAREASGGIYITDTTLHTGPFGSILVLAAAVGAIPSTPPTQGSNEGQIQGDLSAVTMPVGVTIWGPFDSVTLASGKVIAYFKP